MRRHPIIFLSVLVVIAGSTSCKHSTAPPTTFHFEIDTTIVPTDSLGQLGGTGFYYKQIVRALQWSPSWGDSIVAMLLDSTIALVEFYYPAELGICHDPWMGAGEIGKLSQPDSAICRFGYVPVDSVFTLFCIPRWRHYKITRVADGG